VSTEPGAIHCAVCRRSFLEFIAPPSAVLDPSHIAGLASARTRTVNCEVGLKRSRLRSGFAGPRPTEVGGVDRGISQHAGRLQLYTSKYLVWSRGSTRMIRSQSWWTTTSSRNSSRSSSSSAYPMWSTRISHQ